MQRTLGFLTPAIALFVASGCSGSLADGQGDSGAAGSSSVAGTVGGPSAGSAPSQGSGAGGVGNAGAGTVGGSSSAGSATAGNASAGSATGGVSVKPSTQACPSNAIAGTPLRRLTKFEYANTVKALLNVDPSPTNDLPPDEVTDAFSNNAGVLTVSALHAEKYVLASEALAKAAVANLATLTGCDVAKTGEDACAAQFAKSFGRRTFRRPTTAEDEQLLLAAYNAGKTGGSYAEGIEVMIRAALQSPHFLYRLELTPSPSNAPLVPLSQFELATRLSFLLWSTGPDDALLDAAAASQLMTKEQVAAKARAMLKDPKARVAITQFYNEWLGTSRLDITSKDPTLFPQASQAVIDAMSLEMPAFLQNLLWSGDHKVSSLFTSNVAFVTPALAPIYGVAAPAGSGPQMVTLPPEQGRAGLLTQAGFLAVQAHPDQTSPVLRGKFVRSRLLCTPPPPPPPDINITPPKPGDAATARERFSAHQDVGASCNGCHQLMDPIGFAFENFDALGQYRTTENGKTIDVSGEIVAADDPALAGKFNGVRELADKLAGSKQVRDCVATQWFRYASGRNEASADACSLGTLQEAFDASGGDLLELIVNMTQVDSFWYRPPTTP